jgi:hypothetical protein
MSETPHMVTVTIHITNAAFKPEPDAEVARILKEASQRILDFGLTSVYLHDKDGEIVGGVVIKKVPM